MPSYSYKSLDSNGNIKEGSYQAQSEKEVIQMIRSNGNKPINVELKEEKVKREVKDINLFTKKVDIKDIIVFSRQLHTMLYAGMPLIAALEVLIDQSENLRLKEALQEVTNDVKKGQMLSESMSNHPKVFPSLLINMIEAGEMTGNLDDVLKKMSVHYDKENKINQQIKRAMIYPIVLSFIAVAAVVFLLTFVMPTIVGMFTSSGVTLPLPTRIVIGISDSLKNYWYIYIGVIVGLIISYKQFVKTKKGKKIKDKILINLPIIKKNMIKIITSRFTRTLSTLLGSGIPILEALETSANVTNNEIVIEGIEGVSDDIKKGESLSTLLKEMDFFPKMMVSMISIGEESGSIEEMLRKSADYYDDELESSLKKLVALIEPIAILVMGVVIGFIVIAMMLPMFEMFKTIGV
ncbi:MAG: type II secretion system F family protein [Bacillota bacterium]